jgi:outer membrane protein assembly factor BamB
LLFMVNGLRGDFYAVRPGGAGDVTQSHLAWHTPRRGGRDQPSPLVMGAYVLVTDMAGVATCYEAKSGKELWKERLNGTFSSTPIAAGGLAYYQSEEGTTYVLEPGPTMKLVARNTLRTGDGALFRASLAASAGQIFSRSDRALYCLGRKSGAGEE